MNFSNKTLLFLFAAIVLIAGLYCFNPFDLYFQNDDFIHIPLSAHGKLFQHNSFRPLCDLSVMLDYLLWKKNAVGYHFTNLILHLADVVMLFIFCRNLLKKYNVLDNVYTTSLIAALLFFIYPNHSEAIFWILGRSASLSVLFFLMSLIFYLKRSSKKYFILSLLFAIFAWLTYESTWLLPVIFVIISYVDIKMKISTFKKEIISFLIFASCFLFYLSARFYIIHEVIGNYEAANFLEFHFKALSDNFITLMVRSFLPFMKNLILQLLICCFIILTLLTIFLLNKDKRSRAFISIIFFTWLISLLPAASLGVDTYSSEGERFLYLPSLFFCIMFPVFISKFLNKKIARIILIFVFGCSVFLLFQRRDNYLFAEKITYLTLNEIDKIKAEKISVNGLPQSQNGALIFSKGFNEAIMWMTNKNADSIRVLSFRNKNLPLKFPYRIKQQQSLNNYNSLSFTDSVLVISKSSGELK